MTLIIKFDCRLSCIHANGESIYLSPDEEAVLFWRATGTPLSYLARVTGREEAELVILQAKLSSRVGYDLEKLSADGIEFVHGTAPRPSLPWEKRNMASLVHTCLASRAPDDFFIFLAEGGALTVEETLGLIARIRSGWDALGIGQGDVIACDSVVRLETYLVNLAAWMHGAVILRLVCTSPTENLLEQVRLSPAKITYSVRSKVLEKNKESGVFVGLSDELNPTQVSQFETWLQTTPQPNAQQLLPADVHPSDLCVISNTSGSTGLPKAVLLSNAAIWWCMDRTSRFGKFLSSDVFCSASDFVGDVSTAVMTGLPLIAGAKVLIPSAFAHNEPIQFAAECTNSQVNVCMIVPAALRVIMAAGERVTKPFLAEQKCLLTASAPFGEPLATALRDTSEVEIIENLGSREYGGSLTAFTKRTRVISAGGGLETEVLARIVNDDGTTTKTGEIGRLLVVSLGMMLGYSKTQGQDRSHAVSVVARPKGYDLWYDTGDLAFYTANDEIKLAGRSTDKMKTPDGQIVMPVDIEDILLSDNSVQDACIFSFINDEQFEQIGGAVIPRSDCDTAGLDVRLRHKVQKKIGHLKAPVGLWITDSFPRIAQNKVNKVALKEMYIQYMRRVGSI